MKTNSVQDRLEIRRLQRLVTQLQSEIDRLKKENDELEKRIVVSFLDEVN